MSSNQNLVDQFVGYEYKRVTVPKEMDGLWADSLQYFGWELDKKEPSVVKHLWGPLRIMMAPLAVFGGKFKKAVMDHDSDTHEDLKFKRDRHIRNKAELTRLQHQFEACAEELKSLERSKTVTASVVAYTMGLIGSAFMAGSVFAYIGGMFMPSIALAVPGFLGWIIPCFTYRKLKKDKTAKLIPIINRKYDEIYTTCEKANSLLSGEKGEL